MALALLVNALCAIIGILMNRTPEPPLVATSRTSATSTTVSTSTTTTVITTAADDAPPQPDDPHLPPPSNPGQVALPYETHNRDNAIYLRNLRPGPLTVRVSALSSHNLRATPPLPLIRTVPASTEQKISRFGPIDPYSSWSVRPNVEYRYGSLAAQPDATVYRIPLPPRYRYHLDSSAKNIYAFIAPHWTEVRAAREGRVTHVEDRFSYGIAQPGKENCIFVAHSDGTMAYYGSLEPNSIRVRPGQRIQSGQTLALVSPNALQFEVYYIDRKLQVAALPLQFQTADGPTELTAKQDYIP